MRMILSLILLLAVALPAHAGRRDWQVGLQCWTLRGKTLLDTVDYCVDHGIKYLEIYPGQRLGDGFEGKTGHTMTAAERAKLRAILEAKGIHLLSYGVIRPRGEEEWRQAFAFAKEMGIQTLICEPGRNQMEMLDKLAAEYGVNVGIHNHGEPTPDMVEKLLEGRSERIGIAPDIGHWCRRGFDPVANLKRFEGRVLSIHLKDIDANKRDVHFGTGTTPVDDILTHLDKVGYKGPIIIEYESGNQAEAVKQCVDYLRAFIDNGKAPEDPVAAHMPDEYVQMANISEVELP